MKQIEIIVSREGQTTIKTTGFTGPSCREASKFLEQALGHPVSEQLTGEYFGASEAAQQQHERS